MATDLLDALRGPQPVLTLPSRSAWLDLYRRAWQALDPADLPEPGPAYAAIRALRAAGEDELAGRTVADFLDHLAAEAAPPASDVLAALLLLIEDVLGLRWLAEEERLIWTLREEPPVGIQNLRLGDNRVSLLAQEDTGGGVVVGVEATQAVDLQIDGEFTTFSERIPAGSTRLLLTHLDRTDVRRV